MREPITGDIVYEIGFSLDGSKYQPNSLLLCVGEVTYKPYTDLTRHHVKWRNLDMVAAALHVDTIDHASKGVSLTVEEAIRRARRRSWNEQYGNELTALEAKLFAESTPTDDGDLEVCE